MSQAAGANAGPRGQHPPVPKNAPGRAPSEPPPGNWQKTSTLSPGTTGDPPPGNWVAPADSSEAQSTSVADAQPSVASGTNYLARLESLQGFGASLVERQREKRHQERAEEKARSKRARKEDEVEIEERRLS